MKGITTLDGGKQLPLPPQTLWALTPAGKREPGCGRTYSSWKAEQKGKGAEEWKPALGEGNLGGKHLGLRMGSA